MTSRELGKNIRQVAKEIVALVRPSRIILFGSAAQGKVGPDSDLDFLVVISGKQRPDAVTDCLNLGIRHRPMPCDFVVVTESTLKKQQSNAGLLYAEILERGRVIYAA